MLDKTIRKSLNEIENEDALHQEIKDLAGIVATKLAIGGKVVAGVAIPQNDLDSLLFNSYQGRDINEFPDLWKPISPSIKIIQYETDHYTFCLNIGNGWTENFCDAVIEFIQGF